MAPRGFAKVRPHIDLLHTELARTEPGRTSALASSTLFRWPLAWNYIRDAISNDHASDTSPCAPMGLLPRNRPSTGNGQRAAPRGRSRGHGRHPSGGDRGSFRFPEKLDRGSPKVEIRTPPTLVAQAQRSTAKPICVSSTFPRGCVFPPLS